MKRSEMIEQLVKIYSTRPEGCSDYHIVDMLLYAAEKRGMKLVQEVQVSSGTSNSGVEKIGIWKLLLVLKKKMSKSP